MKGTRGRTTNGVCLAVAVIAAVVGLAACGGSDPAVVAAPTAKPRVVDGTTLPTTIPAIPDGIYRTRLSKQDLDPSGDGFQASGGLWTLTIKDGAYRLQCEWVGQEGSECGNTNTPERTTVEAGAIAGDATTVWMEYDEATTNSYDDVASDQPTNEQAPPARLTWRLDGDDLVFPSGEGRFNGVVYDLSKSNWGLRPWKKVG